MDFPQENYLKVGPYLETLQGIRTALQINEGIIKVVGVEGAGKSSLCELLVSDLEAEKQDVIYFETPPESPEELHQHIQSALGLDKNRDFNRALTRYLMETSSNRKLIIIYNDAEKISKDLFILIRLLNNIHDQSNTLVSQIITGTNKLDSLFDDPALRSLTQYLNQSFTLPAMTREQLDDFYSAYKKLHGFNGKDMSNKELTDLFLVSKGLPGKAAEIITDFYSEKESVEASVSGSILLDIPKKAKTDPSDKIALESRTEITAEAPDETLLAEPIENLPQKTGEESIEVALEALVGESEPPLAEEPGNTPDEVAVETSSAELVEECAEEQVVEQNKTPEDSPRESPQTIDTQEAFLDDLEFVGHKEEPPLVTDVYEQEVNEILYKNRDDIKRPGPDYFKLALSAVVVITTMILAFVLSGNNETVNNKIAEILAVETPLYMDEITADNEGLAPVTEIADTGVASPINEPEIFPEQLPEQMPEQSIASTENSLVENQNTVTLIETLAAKEVATEPDSPIESIPTVITSAITSVESQTFVDEDDSLQEISPENVNLDNSMPVNSTDMQISNTIEQWVSSWEKGDFDTYLSAYHENFRPSYHDSYQAWLAQRRNRVQNAQGLSISFDDLDVVELFDDEVMVRFWLQYAKGSYADNTLKEIRFIAEGNRWLIQSERNIDVINISY